MVFITALIFILLVLGSAGATYYCHTKHSYKKYKPYAIALTFVFFIIFLLVPFGFTEIQTGEVGVIKVWGEAKEIKSPGIFWRFWVSTKVEKYDIRTQQIDLTPYAYSQDAQTMKYSLHVQFRVQPDKALIINEKFGGIDILTSRLSSVAEERSKIILSSQSAMKIIENRDTLSNEVETLIKETTEQYYVDIVMVVVSNIDFSDAFESVVENKMIAEQEKLKAQFEKEKAIIKAEELLEVAKLKAEEEIAKAKGEAEAQIQIATAQAESIRLKSLEIARMLGFEILDEIVEEEDGSIKIISSIITEGKTAEEISVISEYLKYIEYLNTWDGRLPEVVVGDDALNIILPLP